jgi:hypothetical protein
MGQPLAPYGRQRPGKTAVRTSLSPRYLMRAPVQVSHGHCVDKLTDESGLVTREIL